MSPNVSCKNNENNQMFENIRQLKNLKEKMHHLQLQPESSLVKLYGHNFSRQSSNLGIQKQVQFLKMLVCFEKKINTAFGILVSQIKNISPGLRVGSKQMSVYSPYPQGNLKEWLSLLIWWLLISWDQTKSKALSKCCTFSRKCSIFTP